MAKFKFNQKLEIVIPKADSKNESKKMQAAMRRAVTRGAQKGAIYVEEGLRVALDNSLRSNWDWSYGPARDIVDTGKLLKSLEIKTNYLQTKIGFQISYNTPYAAFVHYGGVIKPYGNQNARDVLIPGRPWVQAILDGSHGQPQFDMYKPFNRGITEVWKDQFG